MRKGIVLALLAGLCLGAFNANAQGLRTGPTWRSQDVYWRITGNALTGQDAAAVVAGYLDSLKIYNGATADLDTSRVIDLRDLYGGSTSGALADSLQFIWVEVNGDQAFASGESLYVTFDHVTSSGALIGNLGLATCSVCNTGGYHTAASLVPGTTRGDMQLFNGAGSATSGHVAQAGWTGTATRTCLYGNFGACPFIRLRMKSDYVTAPVVQLIRVTIHYLSNSEQRTGSGG